MVNVVTKKKVASKDESQFEIKSINTTETFDDDFQDLLCESFDSCDVVGAFPQNEEEVKIQVNNKVTTCPREIEVCCKILPPQCNVFSDCLPGLICDGGQCRNCQLDSECPTGQECEQGVCTTPPTPAPEEGSTPPPTTTPPPPSAPKCGVRNEKGTLENGVSITAEFPSDGRARLELD